MRVITLYTPKVIIKSIMTINIEIFSKYVYDQNAYA